MLSGKIYVNVNTRWRLSISWSAKQNLADNESVVTAKMYWESLDGYGAVYSGATKDGAIIIDGTTYKFSGAGLAGLNANQKKLIATKSKTIKHNSYGTASFTLDGYFDAEVTLNSYVGRINLTAKSFKLDTIPRNSTLTSSASLTVGSDKSISISKASSSFTHKVYVDLKNTSGDWVNIKDVDLGSSTSESTSFTTSEKTKMFQTLNGRASCDIRWRLYTYNDGSSLGSNTYTGTATAPAASKITKVNGSNERDVYSNQEITFTLERKNSEFTHTLQIYTGGNYPNATLVKTLTGVGTSVSWTPSSSEQTTINNSIKGTSVDGDVMVSTYYNGVLVRSATTNDINFNVDPASSSPTFTASGINYLDSNSTTTAITGNNKYLIQNKSNLKVTIPAASKAVAKNGATMSSYSVTVNGVTKTAAYSASADITIDMGTVDVDLTTVPITVKAIDSRGLSTSVTVVANVLPYSVPNVVFMPKRNNGFESATKLSVSGTASPLNVSGSNKNSIQTAVYKYRKLGDTTWATTGNLTISGFPAFSATTVTATLDNGFAWEVQIEITDKLGTTTVLKQVDVGKPILFIDPILKSVGFGDYPNEEGAFMLNGRLVFGSTVWADSSGLGEGHGAIELNNSDIIQANGIYFADVSQDNNGEGLLFLKSGKPAKSTSKDDYDTLLVRDGIARLNGNAILDESNLMIATGSVVVSPKPNTPTSLDVSFGKTFPSTPIVLVTGRTTVPGTSVTGIGVNSETTTGCKIWVTRTNDTNTIVGWAAIWLKK